MKLLICIAIGIAIAIVVANNKEKLKGVAFFAKNT